jgi:putative membrane protein
MFLLVRLAINAAGLLVAAWIVPGIHLSAARGHALPNDWLTLAIVALIFGVVNVVIRPVVLLLTLPLNILTLGLFTFVVNALMLLLTSWIAEGMDLGFRVDGFRVALFGALIIAIVSYVLNHLFAKRRPE